MSPGNEHAELFINGKPVGRIFVKGHDNSWFFGEFEPQDEFSKYALLFGRWSLLMHADEDGVRLTPEASEELRQAEMAIDQLRAEIRTPRGEQPRRVSQLNIDGKLVDWKE